MTLQNNHNIQSSSSKFFTVCTSAICAMKGCKYIKQYVVDHMHKNVLTVCVCQLCVLVTAVSYRLMNIYIDINVNICACVVYLCQEC